MTTEREELVKRMLNDAFNLGQTYWQQADSESYKQNKLSLGTRIKFEDLTHEAIAALTANPDARDAARYRWLRKKHAAPCDYDIAIDTAIAKEKE